MSLLESPPLAAFTPEDVLKMDGPYELVDGRLVEKQRSALAGKTVSELDDKLIDYPNAGIPLVWVINCRPGMFAFFEREN